MFAYPWFVCLALAVIAVVILRWVRPLHKSPNISFSSYSWLPPAKGRGRTAIRANLLLKATALICLILIAAGIMAADEPTQSPPSCALVIVLDISSSMTADDFPPTSRLEEAKQRLQRFIGSNRDIEMGLILFAGSPRLVLPITPDTSMLSAAVQSVQPAGSDEDGTAIGSGIASAVNRLRGGPWAVRRILLITDGVNNRGSLAPLDAARLARLFGIRIDAIGIGTDRVSRFWVPNPEGSQAEVEARIDIDDKSLESLATETGGRYQRVRNSEELGRALSFVAPLSPPPASPRRMEQGERWARILAFLGLCLLTLALLISDLVYPQLPD